MIRKSLFKNNKLLLLCFILFSASVIAFAYSFFLDLKVEAMTNTGEPQIISYSSYEGVFDNAEHTIGLEINYLEGTFAHQYSYKWYKSNINEENLIENETNNKIIVKNVNDSGDYYCKITFKNGLDEYVSISQVIVCNIAPCNIENEDFYLSYTNFIYNGAPQQPNVSISKFGMSLDDICEFYFTYENENELSELQEYNNQTYFFNAGTYHLSANIASLNYNCNVIRDFIINKRLIQIISKNFYSYDTIFKSYDGTVDAQVNILKNVHYSINNTLSEDNVDITILNASFLNKNVNCEENYLICEYQLNDENLINYRVESNLLYLYNAKIICKNLFAEWGKLTVEFNNQYQYPHPLIASGIVSGDTNLGLNIVGGGTNVGNYSVSLTLNNPNYKIENHTVNFEITPKIIDIIWWNTTCTYNGKYQAPIIVELIGIYNNHIEYEILNSQIFVGEYTVSIELLDVNYSASQDTKTVNFRITPSAILFNWFDTYFVFDGFSHKPNYTITGEIFNEDVLGITTSDANIKVGDYTIAAVIANKNYVAMNSAVGYKISKANRTDSVFGIVLTGEIPHDFDLIVNDVDIKNFAVNYENTNLEKVLNISLQNSMNYKLNDVEIMVEIKLNKNLLEKKLIILHMKSDGTEEVLIYAIDKQNSSIMFKTIGFSNFVILSEIENKNFIIFWIAGIIVFSGLIFLLVGILNKVKISFDSNSNIIFDEVVVNSLSCYQAPKALYKKGYKFDGWYLDKSFKIPFTSKIFQLYDKTLYAKWVKCEKNLDVIAETYKKPIKKIITSKNIKVFVNFNKTSDDLINDKPRIYKILPQKYGYEIVNNSTNNTFCWCKNFKDAVILAKIYAINDKADMHIYNLNKKLKTKISIKTLEKNTAIYKDFNSIYEENKFRDSSGFEMGMKIIYDEGWMLYKFDQLEQFAFSQNLKELKKIAEIYCSLLKLNLRIYNKNNKLIGFYYYV